MNIRRTVENLDSFWKTYKQNKGAVIGLVLALFFGELGPRARLGAPTRGRGGGAGKFEAPSLDFPMGTDNLGRDVFQGVVSGASVSLLVGFVAAGASQLIGIIIGSVSGYLGGRVDMVLMRITEVFQIIPSFFFALILITFLGGSIWNVILVISLVSWPGAARLIRAQFLSLKEKEFVESARAIGEKGSYIIFSEILPNAIPPAIVNASLEVGGAILTESALSFIGLGDPNKMSWGYMLRNAQNYLRMAWWVAFFPGFCIFLLITALNLVGDGLNDVLNPSLKEG